jgi:cell division protein ZapA
MSNVALTIGARSFTVACAEGEEEHVAGLGRMIDGKLSAMGDMAGQSEGRMLLFAALLLADELHEAHRSPGGGLSQVSAERLDTIASRLENLADSLESGQASA